MRRSSLPCRPGPLWHVANNSVNRTRCPLLSIDCVKPAPRQQRGFRCRIARIAKALHHRQRGTPVGGSSKSYLLIVETTLKPAESLKTAHNKR